MLKDYVVIDMEMTGLSAFRDKIIEIGAVKVSNGKVSEQFQTLINPNVNISEKIVGITGITNEIVREKPYIEDVLQDFLQFIGEAVLIGHNLRFDFSFLGQAVCEFGKDKHNNENFVRYGLDTLKIARKSMEAGISKRLEDLCEFFKISDSNHHRALNDAMITMQLYEILCKNYETDGTSFEPERYTYKPKKEHEPSKKEIERVEKMIKMYGITPRQDIYRMTQSELCRYADWLRFNRYIQ